MKHWIFGGFVALCVGLIVADEPHEHSKVVCFWNSTSTERQEPGKFTAENLKSAVSLCTHLIYGYARIDASNYKVMPLPENFADFYKLVPDFKKLSPKIQVYLSIGGNADPQEKPYKYLKATEMSTAKENFVKSVDDLIVKYGLIDGIDLAWQFPVVKVKKNRGTISSALHKIAKSIGGSTDDKEADHREGFTYLVRDLKNLLRPRSKALTLTILPHVNTSVYYDARLLAPNIDAVHLMAFDQNTPERNPKEANYPAPIYGSYGNDPQDNIDSPVRYWLQHGIPSNKIIVGIPSFSRTWKLTKNSQTSGSLPIVTDGPAAEGPYTHIPGLLSYEETCIRLKESPGVQKFVDPNKKYGSYAYLSYDPKTKKGFWLSYDDLTVVGYKVQYVKKEKLGGIAISDVSFDDFHGTCTGVLFPIVSAVKKNL